MDGKSKDMVKAKDGRNRIMMGVTVLQMDSVQGNYKPDSMRSGDALKTRLTNRRMSLPAPAMGLSEKMKRLRRASDLFRLRGVTEEVTDSSSMEVLPAVSKKVDVVEGMARVKDQFEVHMVSWETEKVTHLIYGENYNGVDNYEGTPDELTFVLEKAVDLEILEYRGFWNFTKVPVAFMGFLSTFPKLRRLRKLVLPRQGFFLDRMGSMLIGIFGKQLSSLDCPAAFLEGSCPKDVSLLTPNLKELIVFDTRPETVKNLYNTIWHLEALRFHSNSSLETINSNIPEEMLEEMKSRYGDEVISFI